MTIKIAVELFVAVITLGAFAFSSRIAVRNRKADSAGGMVGKNSNQIKQMCPIAANRSKAVTRRIKATVADFSAERLLG
ncbi:hypothetical protein ACMX25_12275 [Caballeronia sp. 15715]|uniref:hypothetical protein n=1 Tax=Caballeronia sp. 15715 TaxID=3391030 RepID=UPI0039E40594